jgi:hypothetical protein
MNAPTIGSFSPEVEAHRKSRFNYHLVVLLVAGKNPRPIASIFYLAPIRIE